jgi:hypothetical protein
MVYYPIFARLVNIYIICHLNDPVLVRISKYQTIYIKI